VTDTSAQNIRLRGRTIPVLALEPEAPLADWIGRLDAHLARMPDFFRNMAVLVDCSALELARPGVAGLVGDLSGRGIRVMGLTGVEPAWSSGDLPPILKAGRAQGAREAVETPEAVRLTQEELNAFEAIARMLGSPIEQQGPAKAAPLVVNATVRSGQSIANPEGDVTIIGAVASGAEVIAGGSIHVYGPLRGRAMAGENGEPGARIFCRRLEAELLSVGGVYLTADEMEASVRGKAIQAWLEKETVRIARLD
jgi:septum site-determining protein MinC